MSPGGQDCRGGLKEPLPFGVSRVSSPKGTRQEPKQPGEEDAWGQVLEGRAARPSRSRRHPGARPVAGKQGGQPHQPLRPERPPRALSGHPRLQLDSRWPATQAHSPVQRVSQVRGGEELEGDPRRETVSPV